MLARVGVVPRRTAAVATMHANIFMAPLPRVSRRFELSSSRKGRDLGRHMLMPPNHDLLLMCARLRLVLQVENRAILVLGRRRCFGVPVSHVAFRRDNTLNDPVGRPRPMAANAENARAPVRILD